MTPPTHQFLRRIYLLDKSSPDFHEQLNGILHTGHEYDQCVAALGDNDSEWLVNYLDEVRHQVPLSPLYLIVIIGSRHPWPFHSCFSQVSA